VPSFSPPVFFYSSTQKAFPLQKTLNRLFKYPPEIRTLIYTTNAIENFNRQLRKVTKTKSAFVSDDALMKILYLATMNITEKWIMPIKNWGTILDHLSIYFGDRVQLFI